MTETSLGASNELLVELTAEIVAAYVSNHVVSGCRAADAHSRRAFGSQQHHGSCTGGRPVESRSPRFRSESRCRTTQITCLECGGTFQSR